MPSNNNLFNSMFSDYGTGTSAANVIGGNSNSIIKAPSTATQPINGGGYNDVGYNDLGSYTVSSGTKNGFDKLLGQIGGIAAAGTGVAAMLGALGVIKPNAANTAAAAQQPQQGGLTDLQYQALLAEFRANQQPKKDNTILYIILAVVAFVIMFLLLRSKSKSA